MTARVNRQAVLVLTWLVVTTTATAVAWWAVTFVTTEVADRGPLRPSDVVAASVRQAVPVPSWVSGVQPVAGPPPSASDSPAEFASVVPNVPSDPTGVHGSGATRVAAPPAPKSADAPVAPVVGPHLVARWTSTSSSSHVATASVTAVTVALSVPAPAAPVPTVPAVVVTASPEFALTRRTGFTTAAAVAPATTSAPAAHHVAATASTTRPGTTADPALVRRHFRQSGQTPTCPQPASPGNGQYQAAQLNS